MAFEAPLNQTDYIKMARHTSLTTEQMNEGHPDSMDHSREVEMMSNSIRRGYKKTGMENTSTARNKANSNRNQKNDWIGLGDHREDMILRTPDKQRPNSEDINLEKTPNISVRNIDVSHIEENSKWNKMIQSILPKFDLVDNLALNVPGSFNNVKNESIKELNEEADIMEMKQIKGGSSDLGL